MVVKWGQAKIEFIALRDEIFDEHQKGKSRNRIYLDLRTAGRITMSQRSFYVWFDALTSQAVSAPTRPSKEQFSLIDNMLRRCNMATLCATQSNQLAPSVGRNDALRITGEIAPSKPTHELI